MADEATTPEKKTRPKKAPQRRGYKGELDALQTEYDKMEAAVNMAVRLLRKTQDSEANSPAARELIDVAIDTLQGG